MKASRPWLCAAALVLIATAAQAAWYENFKVAGYIQTDFHLSSDDDTDIDLRRCYLGASGQITDQDYFKLQLNASMRGNDDQMKLVVQDAYLVHSFSEQFQAQVGYGAHMLNWEGPFSSSKRPFLERSYASGKFDPGEQELGLVLYRNSRRDWDPNVMLSYGNGLNDWYSKGATEGEAFVARVDLPFGDSSVVGASYRSAWQFNGAALSEDCLNFHVVYNHPGSGLSFWGEYYDGDVKDIASDGMYAGLVYTMPQRPWRVYYRFDSFDQVTSDRYSRHIGGVSYFLTKNQTITAEVGSWGRGPDGDTTVDGRWQITY